MGKKQCKCGKHAPKPESAAPAKSAAPAPKPEKAGLVSKLKAAVMGK